jgi:hypothetical protein
MKAATVRSELGHVAAFRQVERTLFSFFDRGQRRLAGLGRPARRDAGRQPEHESLQQPPLMLTALSRLMALCNTLANQGKSGTACDRARMAARGRS